MPCAPRARLYQDSAAFTAECVTVDPSPAEHVQQVLSAARATLARCRGNDEKFRERPAEPLGGVVPEWRSRGRRAPPLASRGRQSAPAPAPVDPAPQPD